MRYVKTRTEKQYQSREVISIYIHESIQIHYSVRFHDSLTANLLSHLI